MTNRRSTSRLRRNTGRALLVALYLLVLPQSAVAATILLIGDSLSSGYGLRGDTWVEQANQWFSEQGHDINIVNDSISGDTTAGGLARIEDGLSRVEPDWVMIELGGNDGLRGVMPDVIAANLSGMISAARDSGAQTLLLGIRIPPNYGKAYTDRFEQVFVDVAAQTDTPLLPFFVGDLMLDPAYMQDDMIHPNDAAQPQIRDRVLPFLLDALAP